ncbi:MAG: S-layer homology domain-containing protein [Tissierellales bacterium]|nr:S-layer homology domain-containing protein [Tissierellales bacterium]MBN2827184.1 S-layer homology domain-containing protein [Tissierellales bacterium]
MKGKSTKVLTILLAIILILSQSIVFADDTVPVITITGEGVETELSLSLDELKAMPEEAQINDTYIYNSKGGQKSVVVKGVSLTYLLEEAGVVEGEAEVGFTASDDYPINPQPLTDVMNEELQYVVAYEINGLAIDEDDNPDNDEVIIYRKVKQEGEFGTVFKLVININVSKVEASTEEPEDEVVPINFTDITEPYLFADEAIKALASKGIVNGMGNNKYAPEKEFSRAEFSKIMVLSLGYAPVAYQGGFSDISEEDWEADYVQAAVDAGIFQGRGNGIFDPDGIITRQEIAAVAGRAAVTAGIVSQEKLNKFVMEKSLYLDKDLVPEWAENEIAWLEAQGIFTDFIGESFGPTLNVDRAQAAVVVYKTLFQE